MAMWTSYRDGRCWRVDICSPNAKGSERNDGNTAKQLRQSEKADKRRFDLVLLAQREQ
jgi:hypothetical protein